MCLPGGPWHGVFGVSESELRDLEPVIVYHIYKHVCSDVGVQSALQANKWLGSAHKSPQVQEFYFSVRNALLLAKTLCLRT